MEGRLYHFLVMLPIFAVVLLFIVMPPLQWLSERFFDRRFVLRFGGAWKFMDTSHRWDVFFSIVAFIISLVVSFIILETLIYKGILPPIR
jgi:hypothetical protein